jgi:hypothetical protein
MGGNDTQVPRGAAAALDQESPRSFWKGLWSGRFYTWNPQILAPVTAVIDPWPPIGRISRFCTRREVRGCMLGVVWDGMNSLCTAVERDILECLSGSVTTLLYSTNSSSPEFHLAPRRSRLGEIRHIARHGLSVQPERSGGAADRAWRFPAPPFLPPPSYPHSPCSESSGISSRKGCLGLTAPEHGRFHLVIFSTHSYAFFFGPNPLFPFFQCFRDMGRLVQL